MGLPAQLNYSRLRNMPRTGVPNDTQDEFVDIHVALNEIKRFVDVLSGTLAGSTKVFFGTDFPIGTEAPAILIKYTDAGVFSDIEILQ